MSGQLTRGLSEVGEGFPMSHRKVLMIRKEPSAMIAPTTALQIVLRPVSRSFGEPPAMSMRRPPARTMTGARTKKTTVMPR